GGRGPGPRADRRRLPRAASRSGGFAPLRLDPGGPRARGIASGNAAGADSRPGSEKPGHEGDPMNRLSVWFANTQVRNKILLGYGLILLFLIVIALVVAIQAERIQQQNVARERSESLWAASLDMSRAFASMNAALREFALMGDP